MVHPNERTMQLRITLFCSLLSVLSLAQQANLFPIPNQCASFIRMPARHASTDIDAVFFNPAGATKLNKGFHLSLNNQILNQWTTVKSEYQLYTDNPETYSGHVTGFIFPSFYAAYNINKVSFQAGFKSHSTLPGPGFPPCSALTPNTPN